MWSYMKKVMFLPGRCEHWNTICNNGNAGSKDIPLAQILGFAEICEKNMVNILNKSFYLNMSWAQIILYKVIAPFLNVETKSKINCSSDSTLPELK